MKQGSRSNTPAGAGSMREVDLHLKAGYNSADALERQLARFRGELASAVRTGEPGVVFIHGSGSGKLRETIEAIIAAEYPACSCQDAPFSRYGFKGATIVKISR